MVSISRWSINKMLIIATPTKKTRKGEVGQGRAGHRQLCPPPFRIHKFLNVYLSPRSLLSSFFVFLWAVQLPVSYFCYPFCSIKIFRKKLFVSPSHWSHFIIYIAFYKKRKKRRLFPSSSTPQHVLSQLSLPLKAEKHLYFRCGPLSIPFVCLS